MDINGQRYALTPSQALDIQPDVIYVGYAARGADQSLPQWTIKRITLVSGNPTAVEWSTENDVVWDDRASETYT